MLPIHELLNRIRWDDEFGRGDFRLLYYDRKKDGMIEVPVKRIYFDSNDHFDFNLVDESGVTHSIPLHRIRQVYRDGKLIWERHVND